MSSRYDAAVIGGGPAGAVAAATLARGGRSVVVLERDRFPRFHIGESLLPLSRSVFHRIGFWDKLDGDGFVDKWGATFVTADGAKQYRADFTAALPGDEARTFHVERSRFDEMLLRHAAGCGAEVREECRVRDISLLADGVALSIDGGDAVEAGFVIDASGRQGVLAKRLKLRRPDPALKRVAAYGHYEGAAPLEGARDGDIVLISRQDLGWLWLIPLGGGRTSVGAVFDRAQHESGSEPAATLARLIADTPVAARMLDKATPITEPRFEADFSYSVERYAGDRWLLAGDAGSFLDPIFSTGVHLALQAGWEAGSAVLDGRARALRRYDRTQGRRYRYFRKFVAGFYDPAFRDLFFSPNSSKSLYRAIVRVLAGDDRPTIGRRLATGVFMTLTRINRKFPLVPRFHGGGRVHTDAHD